MNRDTTHQRHITARAQCPTVRPSSANGMERFQPKLYKMGLWEIALGVFSVMICVVALCLNCDCYYDDCYEFYTYQGQGIWCGSVLIASGVIGVKSRPTRRVYVANIVVSVISAILATFLSVLSVFALTEASCIELIACHALLLGSGFCALNITVIHFGFSCAGVCCLRSSNRAMVMAPEQPPTGSASECNTSLRPVYTDEPPPYPIRSMLFETSNPAMAMPPEQSITSEALEFATVRPPAYTNDPPTDAVTFMSSGIPDHVVHIPHELLSAEDALESATVQPPAYTDLPPKYTA